MSHKILVSGTTADYIDIIRTRFPGRAVFLTAESERSSAAEPQPEPGEEALCDLENKEDALKKLAAHLKSHKQKLSGVVCFDCESMPLTAFIAKKMKLDYPSPDAIAACRSKFLSKKLWAEANLPCPRFALISSAGDAAAFAEKIAKPVIMKPLTGSGSELLYGCENADEAKAAFRDLARRLANHRDVRMYAPIAYQNEIINPKKTFVIEELVEGPEYSCDFIYENGRARVIRFAEKIRDAKQAIGTTLAYIVPGRVPEQMKSEKFLEQLAGAAKAVGLRRSICMVDIIVDANGDGRMIEIAPRPGGDCLPPLIKQSSGVDMLKLALDFAEKRQVVIPAPSKWTRLVGLRFFATQPGIVKKISVKENADKRIRESFLKRGPGHRVILPPDNFDSRILGHVIFKPKSGDIERECRELKKVLHLEWDETAELLKRAETILGQRTPELPKKELQNFVKTYTARRKNFLALSKKHGSPLYVIEKSVLLARAKTFTGTFRKNLPDFKTFYAMKTNNSPEVASILSKAGYGLDVSSGLELELALKSGAKEIAFSGPAKRREEIALAVKNHKRVTILLDSLRELDVLEELASKARVAVNAGVRLTTDPRGLWRKFGIPLEQLGAFIRQATRRKHVNFCGLHFHTSWNMNADAQMKFLVRLGGALRALTQEQRGRIQFIDIGGGYWPEQGEWLRPESTPEGKLRDTIACTVSRTLVHHRIPAITVAQFAQKIGEAVKRNIFSALGRECRICAEPGRWIVNDACHLLLSVLDRKEPDIAITDGATNALGWERLETDYFPVINLSRPSLGEKHFHVLGSLCTPHDVWGYSYFGKNILPGDVLLIPTQGAYTYSLRQNFIKPLPRTVVIY